MNRTLTELLRQVKAGRSPLDRLRTLALGWRTVRELSPDERSELALHLGLDGAEDLVEKLAARRGGVAPTELLEAVHAARAADPGKLRSLLSSLRQPGARRQLITDGLQALERHLVPDKDLEAFEPLPEDETAEALGSDTPAPQPPEPARPEEGPAASPRPAVQPTPAVLPEPAAASRQPPPAPAATSPKPVSSGSGGLMAPAPSTSPSATPWPPRRACDQAPPSPPRVVPSARAEPFREAAGRQRTLAGRLRVLRRMARTWPQLGLVEARSVLGTFPDGWARRRALVALLERGLPCETDAAITLASGLDNERDRVWALAALLGHRRLSPEDLQAALGLVASAAHRRRLRRLAHAALTR